MDEYTFFTSISAYNYFQNGGTSLIVTRVASGTFSSATSSTIFNEVESGNIPISTNLFGSYTSGGSGGTAGIFSPVTPTVAPAGGSGLTLSVTTNTDNGKLNAIDVTSDVNPTNCGTGPFAGVAITSTLTGVGALGNVIIDSSAPQTPTIQSITITTAGTGYASGETVSIAAGALGTGQLITAGTLPNHTKCWTGNKPRSHCSFRYQCRSYKWICSRRRCKSRWFRCYYFNFRRWWRKFSICNSFKYWYKLCCR